MAKARYQYGTNPRKIEPTTQRKERVQQKAKLKVVENVPRQEVKISKAQRKKQIQLTILALFVFAILLAVGYRNSQISVKFNEMQNQKKQLATLEKENEQLEISIENGLNLGNIENEAKQKLGMQKLTNKQTVYITLPKKDYVEAPTEKIEDEEQKSWIRQIADWIFQK